MEKIIGMVLYKFLDNEAWYYFDDECQKFKLTEKATKEAKESYKEYLKKYLIENDKTL